MEESAHNPNLIVGIGASAGGLEEIIKIVDLLPEDFQATLLVATHRSPDHQNHLKDIIGRHTRMRVDEPVEGDELHCTSIYVGKADEAVAVDGSRFHVEKARSQFRRMKRIDDLFHSVAESAGPNGVGVVLSGMLWDGVEGLLAIHDAGGYCLVQDPRDASFDDMPLRALENVPVNFVGSSKEIAGKLLELGRGRTCH